MADAIVSAVIDHLISIPIVAAEKEVKLLLGVDKEFEKLKQTFRHIREVIEDAEKRQRSNKEVQHWLSQLKSAAFDAEDILDEWSTMISMKKKVRTGLTSRIISTFKSTSYRPEIGHGINEIKERVDEIVSAMHKFNFVYGRTKHNQVVQHRETISGVDESNIRGRVHDKDEILKMLLDETSNKLPLTSISIWEMGGLGKTSLVDLLLNNEYVKERFTSIWVCVSDPFDKIKVASSIIEAIDGIPPSVIEWDAVHKHLCSSLKDRRFLLVLDDVGTVDVDTWKPFTLSFRGGKDGSKIIVTTRKEEVAKMVESTYTHELSKFSEDECWSLFSSRAFAGRGKEERESFELVGKKLSKKCDGLPLAAKTLGCLLQHKSSIQEWENILENKIWAEKTNVLPSILLSYYDLTPQLKRCFEYCAIYPQNYCIKKMDLIHLWMANGFLSSGNEDQLELTGNSCFDTLVARSFFQQNVNKNGDPCYTMHDLIHEFAQSLAKKECLSVTAMNNDTIYLNCSSLRHLIHLSSIEISGRYAAAIFSSSSKATLRTFIRKYDIHSERSPVPSTSTIVSSSSSKRLRVLDLSRSVELKILPNGLEKLIHLRFLDLSCSYLEELPDVVGNLYNLQILNLTGCYALRRITENIGNLVNLRHLRMEGVLDCFLPEGIGRLTSLRTLKDFQVGHPITDQGSHYAKLGELKNLNQLQSLAVDGLSRVRSTEEAAGAQLKDKRNLSTLSLSFGYPRRVYWDEYHKRDDRDEGALDGLEPPSHLEELEIFYYRGSRFPSWMGSDLILSKLGHLQKLTLFHCTNVVAAHHQIFPDALRELNIQDCPKLSWSSVCFPPLLEKLTLSQNAGILSRSFSILCCHPDHNKIKTLELNGIEILQEVLRRLTTLHTLNLFHSKLETFVPGGEELQHLPMLQTLEIWSCSQQLQERCAGEGAEDWNIISHIPNITVGGRRIR